MRPGHFHFQTTTRAATRGAAGGAEERGGGGMAREGVGTQRRAVFFFTRGIAGISHKSREKPGAFEPPSFTVSTTRPSHDSNPSAPTFSLFPPPLQAVAFATPAFHPLSMALWLTTNFSSRLTFCTPALVHGAKLAPRVSFPLPILFFSSHAGDAPAGCSELSLNCNYRR